MNPRIILVGLGCSLALITTKNKIEHNVDRLTPSKQDYANSLQSIISQPGSVPKLEGIGRLGTLPTSVQSPVSLRDWDWQSLSQALNKSVSTVNSPSPGAPLTATPTPNKLTITQSDWDRILQEQNESARLLAISPPPDPPSMPEKVFRGLQALLQQPQKTVAAWDEPWQSMGNIVLVIVDFVLKLAGFVLSILVFCLYGVVIGAVALGLYSVAKPWLKKLYTKAAENPAPFRTVMSAGLGSGFGLLLGMALHELWQGNWGSRFLDLGTLTLVAIGMLIFVEPLTEWIRERVGLEAEHSIWKDDKRWSLRLGAIVILAVTNLAHGLLHEQIHNGQTDSLLLLGTAFLIPAAITFAWIVGARHSNWRSPTLGSITGVLLGTGCVLLALRVTGGNDPELEPVMWWLAVYNGLQWGIAGLIGGMAIDKPRDQGPIRSAAIAVVVAMVCTSLLRVTVHTLSSVSPLSSIYLDLARSFGWACGLLSVEPFALRCLSGKPRATLVKAPEVG
jgi:hypothetical protein